MPACPLIQNCAFFNDKMSHMPSMSDIYKARYCKGDNLACARHRVFASLGRENVPGDLFPNEQDRAAALTA